MGTYHWLKTGALRFCSFYNLMNFHLVPLRPHRSMFWTIMRTKSKLPDSSRTNPKLTMRSRFLFKTYRSFQRNYVLPQTCFARCNRSSRDPIFFEPILSKSECFVFQFSHRQNQRSLHMRNQIDKISHLIS